jgi:hypothetical protein
LTSSVIRMRLSVTLSMYRKQGSGVRGQGSGIRDQARNSRNVE